MNYDLSAHYDELRFRTEGAEARAHRAAMLGPLPEGLPRRRWFTRRVQPLPAPVEIQAVLLSREAKSDPPRAA